MPLVLLSALASVCLAMITYRQWAHHEILSYPIAVFTDQLLVREEGRYLPAVMRNRMFWVGFLLLLVIRVNNGLVVWYPEYYIPVQLNFNMTPFAKVWPELFRVPYGWSLLTIRFFPLVIAFAFFLSSEISFTLGVSQLCWVLVALPMVTVGMNLSTDWVGGWQGWQRAGSYIMMFLILVYTGRNYYADIVMRALGLRRRGQPDATDRANVWAFRVLAVAFVALVGFLPPYYPPRLNRRTTEGERLLRGIMEELCAELDSRIGHVKLVECFSGIMDLSFMGFQGEAEELEALAGNMPGWGTVFSLPMDDLLSLDVPIASMGTSGKDAHKDTERLELDYSFRIAPQLLERLIARLGEASGKAGGDENANTAH